MFYTFCRSIAKSVIHIKFLIEVTGMEHIPKEGPVIIAANHVSNYDPIILMSLINRKIHFLAKKELFSNRFSHWFFSKIHAIPVDRSGGPVIRSVRQALRIINEGEVFGIFPEGTRCRYDEWIQPKKGVRFFAVKTEAPIIPIALVNITKGLLKPIKVIIGEPVYVTDVGTTDYAKIAELVMDRIREMMALSVSHPERNPKGDLI